MQYPVELLGKAFSHLHIRTDTLDPDQDVTINVLHVYSLDMWWCDQYITAVPRLVSTCCDRIVLRLMAYQELIFSVLFLHLSIE